MKFLVVMLLSLSFSIQANAYEVRAIERALDSYFTSYIDFWGISYSENNPSCDLVADVYVSTRSKAYECSICLINDTNNFWSHSDVVCDFARD